MISRSEIINRLIKKNNYTSYLEIGVNNGLNLLSVDCKHKVGVDPDNNAWRATHHITSDQFFKENKEKFDIVFVDGLHEASQVYKDIINSLDILNEGGTIVCHDMKPRDEAAQLVPRIQKIWNGDCWKAWVQLRTERNDLEMFVVDTDEGCGIIRLGKQTKLKLVEEITYSNLAINEDKWLNLKSTEYFNEWIK